MASAPRVQVDFDWRKLIVATREALTMLSDGSFRPLLTETGKELSRWMHREYKGLSRREWKKISPLTYVVRREGVKPRPIKTIRMAETGARRALPLIDTGETMNSFLVGRPFNLFDVGNDSVTVGSTSPIAVKHQKAHSHTFTFGEDEQARLSRNVPPRDSWSKSAMKRAANFDMVEGAKGKWNRAHFVIKNRLKKASGKPRTIPARPMPKQPPKALVTKLQLKAGKLFAARIRKIWAQGTR